MKSLRSRFVLSHILPILITVPLLAFALIYIIETQVLLKTLSQNLTESAKLITETIEEHPEVWGDRESASQITSQLSYSVEAQILMIEPDGDILAQDPDIDDALIPEVDISGLAKAQSGQMSVSVTYGWFTQSGEVLVPVFNNENKLVGIVGLTQTLEGTANEFGRLRNLILIIFIVEILFAVLLGLAMALSLERPIKRTVDSVVEIAYGQKIEPLEIEGPREIQELHQAVNFLSKRLNKLEETRRRLLANLVHELGRPLGALLSALHVLRGPTGDDPVIRQELLGGMEKELYRMQPMLDDLAQLHGQVLGAIILNRIPIDMNDWLSPTILPWRAQALEKGLEWVPQIPANLPTLEIDPDRMAQVIGNLLSNAIKYTPAGGTIAISSSVLPAEFMIQIKDNGSGVSPEEQKKIFEPFYRSSEDRRFPQGLGLGLTIARDIMIAHGGELTIHSEYGKGSVFSIHLPHNDKKR